MVRRTAVAVLVLAALSFAQLAHATVTEPNGLAVPTDASVGKEIQLSEYFASVGDAIDEKVDCHTTPDTFSPLCGFTGTFVLNQAGSHFGVGWYNADPTVPTAPDISKIHVIVPAGAAVGTTFAGTDIRKDPAYAGGNIGFALVGGQIHYSEQRYNVVCTACTPAAPWVLALTYQSKKTANGYYLAFEDGSTGAASFANDGDFNDDVFFFTGLVCAEDGKPCDTGKPGVCKYGSTSCVAGKVVCTQGVLPGAKQCNGLDNDCDGKIDDGPCPPSFICTRGACQPKCNSGEFKCGAGMVCDTDGVCREPPCVGKTCPDGTTCVGGACVDACTGVKCPYGQVCRVGVCVDPCASLKCGPEEACVDGLCKPGCACAGCKTGMTCDATSKKCGPTACLGKGCPKGSHCISDGTCQDDCLGVVCPKGQTCTAGACVAVPSSGSDGGLDGGFGDAGPITDGALDASSGEGGVDDLSGAGSNSKGGCSCGIPSASTRFDGLFVALGAVGLALARRRRR